MIAERTGITTVADFRVRDVAAGGHGAPLVSYVDDLLFRHPQRQRAVLNLGGIANVTLLPPSTAGGAVLAFDTGPGNMVLDALAQRVSGGAPCPPAATSRTRKSATVVIPVRSAITAGSPICRVDPGPSAPGGAWNTVCPWEPITSTAAGGTPAAASVSSAAVANHSPTAKFIRQTASAVAVSGSNNPKTAPRCVSEKGTA